jgi:hypothetical protein
MQNLWTLSMPVSLQTRHVFFYYTESVLQWFACSHLGWVQAWRVPLMEPEFPTLPEHLRLPPYLCWVHVVQSSVFCVVFCRWLFVFLFFSFVHCIICFRLLYYLSSSIVLSVFVYCIICLRLLYYLSSSIILSVFLYCIICLPLLYYLSSSIVLSVFDCQFLIPLLYF